MRWASICSGGCPEKVKTYWFRVHTCSSCCCVLLLLQLWHQVLKENLSFQNLLLLMKQWNVGSTRSANHLIAEHRALETVSSYKRSLNPNWCWTWPACFIESLKQSLQVICENKDSENVRKDRSICKVASKKSNLVLFFPPISQEYEFSLKTWSCT